MSTNPARVYLHIGAMKTGTTFIQRTLVANAEQLSEVGYLFPGSSWSVQVAGAKQVVGLAHEARNQAAQDPWGDLARQVKAHDGPSVISMESLSWADAKAAKRAVGSFDGRPVHLVLTVRDTLPVVPSAWQTGIYNGSRVGWEEYLRGVRRATGTLGRLGRYCPDRAARIFLQAANIPRMLSVWGHAVPPDRIHVITVPPAGADRDELWRRFADVLELDPEVAVNAPNRTNTSIGFGSAELLRRVNEYLDRKFLDEQTRIVKNHLALGVLTPLASAESSPQVDRRTASRVWAWNARIRGSVQASGAHVTGDMSELPVSADDLDHPAEHVSAVPPQSEIMHAAAVASDSLKRLSSRLTRKVNAHVGAGLPRGESTPEHGNMPSWADSHDPVGAAALGISRQIGDVSQLRRQLAEQRGLKKAPR